MACNGAVGFSTHLALEILPRGSQVVQQVNLFISSRSEDDSRLSAVSYTRA